MAPLLILDTGMGVKKPALGTLNPSHILCGSVMRDKSMALTRPSSTHWLRGKATSTSGSGFTSTRRTNYRLACRTPFQGFAPISHQPVSFSVGVLDLFSGFAPKTRSRIRCLGNRFSATEDPVSFQHQSLVLMWKPYLNDI